MVEYSDVDELQGVLQALGDEFVSPAGFGYPTGVIVGQYHGGGVVVQGFLDDFAGVDARSVDGAAVSTANILDGNSALGGQVSRWFDGDPHQGSIAVGTLIAERPPHKSRRAQFTHRASTLGD